MLCEGDFPSLFRVCVHKHVANIRSTFSCAVDMVTDNEWPVLPDAD
jgi:hypothetical protein